MVVVIVNKSRTVVGTTNWRRS